MVKLIFRLFGVTTLLATARFLLADGCGLNAFEGRNGTALFFWVIQSSVPTQFSWRIGEDDALTQPIPTRMMAGPGNGNRAWRIVPNTPSAGDASIEVCEQMPDGSCRPAGHIALGGLPVDYTWTEDAHAAPWLFFEVHGRNGRTISAWRYDGNVWRHEADLGGELHIARATCDAVWMGRWRIAEGKAIPIARPVAEELEWFPGAKKTIAFARRGAAWVTTDGGLTWKPLPMPWPSGTFGSLVDSDSDTPVVSWSSVGFLHVARWSEGSWQELATVDKRAHDVAGPIVVLGDRVIALALCYRTNNKGASTVATVVDRGEVTSKTIVMRSR